VPTTPELPASDSTEVAAPGQVDEAPSLGNLPSDSSLDIALPETLEASVPPIESAPSPLEVAPPEGFALDDETIGVFGGIDTITETTCKNTPWLMQCGGSGRPPKTADDKDDGDKPENDNDVGGPSKEREPDIYEAMIIADLSNQIKGSVESTQTEDFINLSLDFARAGNGGTLDPTQQIAVLAQIKQQVSNGMINSVLVDDVVATLKAGKVQELAANGQDLMAGVTLAPDPNQAAMLGLGVLRRSPWFAAAAPFLGMVGGAVGERQFFTALYLTVITGTIGLMASSKDDSGTTPQVVGLAMADFANPDPNDPCNDLDNPNAQGGVYTISRDGSVIRTGRASNLVTREAQHNRSYNFGSDSGYTFDVVYRTDSYILQRGLEDLLFNQFYDTAWKDNGGDNRNSAIRETNPNKDIYRDTTRYCLQVDQWWK
jgi:hypothetical protein